MIYITGDTHGDFSRFSNKKLRRNGMSINSEEIVELETETVEDVIGLLEE